MPYKHRTDLYAAQRRHRERVRVELLNYLKTKSCIDCGEMDPVVLEFDHKIPEIKYKTIAKMLSGHYSWKSVLDEIQKCDIRCANCHKRKTYTQFKCWGKNTPL